LRCFFRLLDMRMPKSVWQIARAIQVLEGLATQVLVVQHTLVQVVGLILDRVDRVMRARAGIAMRVQVVQLILGLAGRHMQVLVVQHTLVQVVGLILDRADRVMRARAEPAMQVLEVEISVLQSAASIISQIHSI
jgi:hypothetical protein